MSLCLSFCLCLLTYPHHFTHRGSSCQGGSSIQRLLSPPLNLSSCLSHHCTFPPLSIQGAARGRVTGSTNERAAQVGTNQSEGEKLGCSCRTGSAAPLRGEGASSPVAASSPWSRRAPWGPTLSLSTHLHPPKAGFQPYTAPTQPPLLLNASSPALSKDLSALQKVSQLNFAFSSSFSLPSTALQRPPQRNFLGLMRSFSGRGRRSKKDFTIIELLGSQRPPLTPTKLQACL